MNLKKIKDYTRPEFPHKDEKWDSVSTGLSGSVNKEILESVIGQLSDGMWENWPPANKMWPNLKIKESDGEFLIEVNRKSYSSYFAGKTDEQVRAFFASRLKTLIKAEGLDWKRDNNSVSSYVGYKEEVKVSDIYKAYDKLLGRKERKVSDSDINTWLDTLSPEEQQDIADIYGVSNIDEVDEGDLHQEYLDRVLINQP